MGVWEKNFVGLAKIVSLRTRETMSCLTLGIFLEECREPANQTYITHAPSTKNVTEEIDPNFFIYKGEEVIRHFRLRSNKNVTIL
mgnify:CR=1 FL=1